MQNEVARAIDAGVEERLSVLLEGIGDSFYALDREWRFTYINRTAEAYYGIPHQDMLGRVIWDVFPWSAGTELRQRYEQVFASGEPASFEAEAVSAPGHYLEFHIFPYNGGLGVSFRDWTERRRAEEEMRESQARLRALADNMPLGMVYQMTDDADHEIRRLIYMSQTCEHLTGVPAEDVRVNPGLLYELVLPKYRAQMFEKEIEAHREEKPFDLEIEMRHARTGEIRWHRIVVTPRRLANGTRVWDGTQIDITDHKRAEEHLHLLVNELNHRVKNTLATVQSLAAQSFSKTGTDADGALAKARHAFEARLFALARGHDALTRENWEGARLAEIVDQAFAPYRREQDNGNILETEGPDLRIAPSMALSLSMALHELCTNALKYGALSVAGGCICIAWSVAEDCAGNRLTMRWEERGGPPVKPPTRKGFGSRLIEGGLSRELNGSVRLAYEPAGVVCTIDVPLS
ncbi:sensor histidine kinase [Microvirga sp. 2TAF3]|uniref:sensor histidine kinase n=1 Tax=Microvirga sp. 2TAF3 TaxID=3233014 RepID=UPI003F99B39B